MVVAAPATQPATGGFNFDLGAAIGDTLNAGINYLGVLGQLELRGDILKQNADHTAYMNRLNAELAGANVVSQQTQAAGAANAKGFIWKPWMTYTAVGLGITAVAIAGFKALS